MRHDGTGCINEQPPALVGLIRVAEEDMSLLFILSHLSAARRRMSHNILQITHIVVGDRESYHLFATCNNRAVVGSGVLMMALFE